MKKLLCGLFLVLMLSAGVVSAYPKWPEIPSPTGSSWVWDDTNKVWRPTSGSPLGVINSGVSVTIGSTTYVISPVFSDESGSSTLGLVDADRRLVVNLGSETIGLLTELVAIDAKLDAVGATNTAELQVLQAITASITAKLAEVLAEQASTTAAVDAVDATLLSGVNVATMPAIALQTYTTASYSNIVLTPNVAYDIPLMAAVDFMSITNSSDTGRFWVGLKTASVAISTGIPVYSNISIEKFGYDHISIIASTALPIAIDQQGH